MITVITQIRFKVDEGNFFFLAIMYFRTNLLLHCSIVVAYANITREYEGLPNINLIPYITSEKNYYNGRLQKYKLL